MTATMETEADVAVADIDDPGGEAQPPVDVGESKMSVLRPDFELLKRRRCSMIRQRERRALPLTSGNVEMRAMPDGTGGTKYEFRGYASTFDDWFTVWDKWNDEYEESVKHGGFTETLSGAWGGPDVRFYIGHNEAGLALARTAHGQWPGTMRLLQDSRGLDVSAPDLDGRNSDVRNMHSAMERGDVDSMSIGFVTRGQQWSDDYARRQLTSLDLHNGDVSVVSVPANPYASGATMIPLSPGGGMSLSRQAAEARASRGEINDNSNAPDFNVVTDDPAANGVAAVKCPHTVKNGCGQMLPGGSKFCSNCGGPVYDGDGTLVVDDSGVVTEEGDKADADLLSRRLRLLELA